MSSSSKQVRSIRGLQPPHPTPPAAHRMRLTIHFSVASSPMPSFSLRLRMLIACAVGGRRAWGGAAAESGCEEDGGAARADDGRSQAAQATCAPAPSATAAAAHLVYAAVVFKQELAGGLHEGVLGGHQEKVRVQDLWAGREGGV